MNTLSKTIGLSTVMHVTVVALALLGVGVMVEPEPVAAPDLAPAPVVTFQTVVLPEPIRDELAMTVEDGADRVEPDEEVTLGATPEPEPERVEPTPPRPPKAKRKARPKAPEPPAAPPEEPQQEVAAAPTPELPVVAPVVTTDDASVATTQAATERAAPESEGDAVTLASAATGAATSNSGAATAAPAEDGAAPGRTVRQGAGGKGLGGGIDRAGLLKGYRKAVFRELNRHKHYPRLAKRARLTGVAYVRITIDARGKVLSATIRKSSGHKVLDDGALETVRRMGSLPKPPGELGWTTRALDIPIKYSVR